MSTPAIEIIGLTKEYPVGFWRKRMRRSLDNLTLSVEEGEIFGFLGPNGAGKTTTLKLLMGLIFPTAGTARICGCSIDDVRMHRDIGYLPEQPYFYDYLTARELWITMRDFRITAPPSAANASGGFSTALDWRPPATYSSENFPRACFEGRESPRPSCTTPR